jgi:hypothetical protein
MPLLSAPIVFHEIGVKVVWYIFVLLGCLINARFKGSMFIGSEVG